MSPEDLLSPFSVREPGEDRYSIFQATTWHRTRFKICWERLKTSPINGLTSLGPIEIRHICQFVDGDLAEDLLKSGLDLGKPHTEDAAPGWLGVVTRKDPVPMMDWFLSHGHKPPENLLKYAATHNCIQAAGWIMDQIPSRSDWCEAALVVAKSEENESAEMLAIILRNLAAKWDIEPTLSQNIVINIVHGVSDEAERRRDFYDSCPDDLVIKEDVAVRKVQTLGDVVGRIEVVGMKIMAEKAGLYRLSMELGNPNQFS
jgi:hypothetical protein